MGGTLSCASNKYGSRDPRDVPYGFPPGDKDIRTGEIVFLFTEFLT